jgi:hypothetical protein
VASHLWGVAFRDGARRGVTRTLVLLWLVAGAWPVPLASAQVTGHVSLLVDALPDPDPAPGDQGVAELRARVFAEHRRQFGTHLRVVLSGHVDGVVASGGMGGSRRRGVTARPLDLYTELTWSRVEVRAGASRVVWGRLDEFQPTDVVNPIDISRFLLEGRAEARLAVGLVRTRLFLPASTTLEVIAVPGFRAGRFDQLDEPSSPFNLGPRSRALVRRDDPSFGADSLQGGARLTGTAGRIDWGATAYRGLRAFPVMTALGGPTALSFAGPLVQESFPRFTMVGGDFETVRGAWGLRGEAAVFVDDTLQATLVPRGVEGRSVEAGVGVDRRAGEYRLAANVLVAHRTSAVDATAVSPADPSLSGTDVSLVVAADRSFARETRTLRLFAVYDPENATTFTRAIAAVNLRDNVWVEGSAGVFTGTAPTTLGRLTNRDFVYGRLKVSF